MHLLTSSEANLIAALVGMSTVSLTYLGAYKVEDYGDQTFCILFGRLLKNLTEVEIQWKLIQKQHDSFK